LSVGALAPAGGQCGVVGAACLQGRSAIVRVLRCLGAIAAMPMPHAAMADLAAGAMALPSGNGPKAPFVPAVHPSPPLGFGEDRVQELRALLGKADGDALRIVGVGAGAWGSVFVAMLQDAYGAMRDSVQVGSSSPPHRWFVLMALGPSACV
jgi:hypothetical protein